MPIRQPDASDKPSEYDESTATFTFSMCSQKDECPEGIKDWDKEAKWKFLYDSISSWDDVLYVPFLPPAT